MSKNTIDTSRGGRVPLVFCFDKAYARYAAVSTLSARLHASTPLSVYWIFTTDAADEVENLLGTRALSDLGVEPIQIDDDHLFNRTCLYISRATYLRLLIPKLIDEEKVIYLDSDTLILRDLKCLYETNLEGYPIAGVECRGSGEKSALPREVGDQYINAGVMLMDLARLRDDGFDETIRTLYKEYEALLTWNDQCLLNKYAEKRKKMLSPTWNSITFPNKMSSSEFNRLIAAEEVSVLHFVGPVKPWHSWCNPAASAVWWSYARRLNLPHFQPEPINSLERALLLAGMLDLDGNYKQSSNLKSHIIQRLLTNQGKA